MNVSHILIAIFIIIVPASIIVSSFLGKNKSIFEIQKEKSNLESKVCDIERALLMSGLIEKEDRAYHFERYKDPIDLRIVPLLLEPLNLKLVELPEVRKPRRIKLVKKNKN